ncbi:hypothetical protein ACLOJK_010791 [Asimina triloba]
MEPPFLLLAFLHLPFILLIPTLSCETSHNADSVRFELFHRHHRELSERIIVPQTDGERLRESVHNDQRRHRWISMKLGGDVVRRRAQQVAADSNDSFRIPISSGAYAYSGSYFVIFSIGTPSQRFLMVADTGSDLAWMNCRYRCRNCKRDRRFQNRRIFRADDSKTFAPIPCSSRLCTQSILPESVPTICPEPTKPCYYQYGYLGGSRSMGFYANESATVYLAGGGRRKIKGILIGCSTSFGGSTNNMVDGILGLGHSGGYSFSDVSLKHFGGKFSYCLVDRHSSRNQNNYLIFGPTPQPSSSSMTYATLIANELNVPHYGVDVKGISVGGVMLDIPPMVWDLKSRGGAIIDSGTTLTLLPEPAFVPVMKAFRDALKGFREVPDEMFDFCFSTENGFMEDAVPRFVWHLGESVRFEPPLKSYILSDVGFENIRCLGFWGIPWPGITIIGNLMQQEHFWEFDIKNGRLGFRPSSCILD